MDSSDIRLCNDIGLHASQEALATIKRLAVTLPTPTMQKTTLFMALYRFRHAVQELEAAMPDFAAFVKMNDEVKGNGHVTETGSETGINIH